MKKNSFYFLAGLFAMLVFAGCKERKAADVIVKYEVITVTKDRPISIYCTNNLGGEDAVFDTATTHWVKTFRLRSDTTQKKYSLRVYCGVLYTNNVSQTVTTNIYEDNKLISTQKIGGTAYISSYDTEVLADLPTAVKYE